MNDKTATMHIGEMAEKSGLSLRTLRHYDEIGLVSASGRTEGGFRLYTQDDFERLILIRRMKPLGFTLDEMAELLRIIDTIRVDSSSQQRAALDAFIQQAEEQRETLRKQLDMADEFLALLRAR